MNKHPEEDENQNEKEEETMNKHPEEDENQIALSNIATRNLMFSWWWKLICFFGFHDWLYSRNPKKTYPTRCCRRCNKWQRGSYDPLYGSTDWSKI